MKAKFSRSRANAVADELEARLGPACTQILACGSLRRMRYEVGDLELCYVPRIIEQPDQDALFGAVKIDQAEAAIGQALRQKILKPRPNVKGAITWGPRNKLAIHVESGVPVDLFATTEDCWPNYIVSRTGPAKLNQQIASLARERGLRWHPYGKGFTRTDGSWLVVGSEREVFEAVGLRYLEPRKR
jgi:DNA polymerase/3'-5' exonuclease PolX